MTSTIFHRWRESHEGNFKAMWSCPGCRHEFLGKCAALTIAAFVAFLAITELWLASTTRKTRVVTMQNVSRVLRYDGCDYEFIRMDPETRAVQIWAPEVPCPRIVADVPSDNHPWVRVTELTVRKRGLLFRDETVKTLVSAEIHLRSVADIETVSPLAIHGHLPIRQAGFLTAP